MTRIMLACAAVNQVRLFILFAAIALPAMTGCGPLPGLSDSGPLPESATLPGVQGDALVKFGAPWCGPCRSVDTELDRLDGSTGLQIVRINVDKDPGLAREFHVSAIPHLFLIQDGKVIAQQVGYRSESQIRQWVTGHGLSLEGTASASVPAVIHSNPFVE